MKNVKKNRGEGMQIHRELTDTNPLAMALEVDRYGREIAVYIHLYM
jgi:hypothetical protein